MSSSPNGRHGNHHDPIRKLRYDDLSAIMDRTYSRGPRQQGAGAAVMPWSGRTHSGRRFVIAAAIAVLVLWGVLYLVFREWRARYRERAAYGASQVVPAIDPLAEIDPPGVDPERWRDAVARTHAMLLTFTASNVLGLDEMRQLRAELDRAADRARVRPETAVAELAAVWDDMAERGEFLLKDSRVRQGDRHPRPEVLPTYGADRVAPVLDPLAEIDPPGVDPARWRDAVSRTREQLLVVTDRGGVSTVRMKGLRAGLDRVVARARANPETAVAELEAVWDSLDPAPGTSVPEKKTAVDSGTRPVRPEIFPPRR